MMSFNKNILRHELSEDEGRIPYAYPDSEGYWTIGVGHLIDKRKGGHIPEHIINALLDYDIDEAAQDAMTFPWFEGLSGSRQEVIINMIFNMGLTKFRGFKKTIQYIKNGEHDLAATEMLDSKWARQVKKRAVDLSEKYRKG